MADLDEELQLGLKKKKKTKAPKGDEVSDVTEKLGKLDTKAIANEDDELAAELKATKKKKKTEKPVEEANEDEELLAELKSMKKKKKTETDAATDDLDESTFVRKKKKAPQEELGAQAMEEQSKIADAAGYSYDFLLTRAFNQLRVNNPELVSDQNNKLIMAPPQLARIGSKKTLFSNFQAACKALNREPAHLSAFIFSELGTTGSVDSKGALLIRGRYTSKHIEPLLLSYCRTYVKCGTCQSPKTVLDKDSRLLFVQCLQCHSKITVKNVSTGFQAVTGKRAAIRAKTQ